jgi:hypothetical protein
MLLQPARQRFKDSLLVGAVDVTKTVVTDKLHTVEHAAELIGDGIEDQIAAEQLIPDESHPLGGEIGQWCGRLQSWLALASDGDDDLEKGFTTSAGLIRHPVSFEYGGGAPQ